jgi:hypothetical protein
MLWANFETTGSLLTPAEVNSIKRDRSLVPLAYPRKAKQRRLYLNKVVPSISSLWVAIWEDEEGTTEKYGFSTFGLSLLHIKARL